MKVYFISGLAADRRVFNYIQLPEQFEIIHLDWITPEKRETLSHYARRLSEPINTQEPFALVGLSMGGMIASEIASEKKPTCTVLISSVPVSSQLPIYFKWAGRWGIQKIVPVRILKSASILKRLFTVETSEEKKLLRQVIRDSDPAFIEWAMTAILEWNNEILPSPYVHIHGTKDEVLPLRYTKPTHIIEKAGHLMVMTRASQLNTILAKVLE